MAFAAAISKRDLPIFWMIVNEFLHKTFRFGILKVDHLDA